MALETRLRTETLETNVPLARLRKMVAFAPLRLPKPPRAWSPVYRRMAAEVAVNAQTFEDGVALAERFINPLLDGSAGGLWVADEQQWSDVTLTLR